MKQSSKTVLALLLSLLMLLGTMPLVTFAANDTIQYAYDADTKTLTITGTGAIDDYVGMELFGGETPFDPAALPAWYQACGHDAEAIVVGENITEIGDGAFLDFRNVTSVTLPSTLTRIGDIAFMFCESLSAISLPASLTEIGELAFVDTALTSIDIPGSVETLAESFAYTTSLQQVTLHEGLRTMQGAFAFSSLQTLDIPSTVESFYDNYIFGLQTVINRSATAVVNGDCAMELVGGESLAARFYRYQITHYGLFLRKTFIDHAGDEVAASMELLNAFMTENGQPTFATEEEAEAFFDNQPEEEFGFMPVELTLYCLDESAQHNYAKQNGMDHYLINADGTLSETLCPDSGRGTAGENIEWWIDAETKTLHISGSGAMSFPNSSAPWRSKATKIEHVVFTSPEGAPITSIPSYAFTGMRNLTELTVPEGVTQLGSLILEGSGVKTLRLPASYSPNGWNSSTLGYTSLDTITVADGNETLFVYNGGLYQNRTEYFYQNYNYHEDIRPTLVKLTGDGVGLNLHPDTYRIMSYALEGLADLTSFTIPASVDTVDYYALNNLPAFTTLTIAARTAPLNGSIGGAVTNAPNFTAFVTQTGDTQFLAVDGILYNADGTKLIGIPCGVANVTLAETVTGYNYSGSSFGSWLQSVTILNADFDFDYSTPFCSDTKIIGHTGSTAEEYAMKNGNEFESLEGLTLVSLVIDTSEAQTVFQQFDWPDFNHLGFKAVATYSDGSTRTFTDGFYYTGNFSVYRTGSFTTTITYRDLQVEFPYTVVRKLINVTYPTPEGYTTYHSTYTYSGETSIVELKSDVTASGRVDFSLNNPDKEKVTIVIAEDEALENVLYTASGDFYMYPMTFEAGKTYYVGITAGQLAHENDTLYVSICPFLICDHPSATFAPAETGTCQQYLKKDRYVCDVCGRDLLQASDGTYYEPNSYEYKEWGPHTPVDHHDYVPYTCTTAGNYEYWTCEVCGQYLIYNSTNERYETIGDPTLPPYHTGLEYWVASDPTCTTPGQIAHWYCRDCGKYFAMYEEGSGHYGFDGENPELTAEDVILPASHDLEKHEGYAPTCTAGGVNDYWRCTVCNRAFLDEAATQEITSENVHDVLYPAALGHQMTYVPAKDATCEADGNTAYYKCERCEKFFTDEDGENEITDHDSVMIAAGAHTIVPVAGTASTCEVPGTIDHYECEICHKLFSDAAGENEITDIAAPLADHSYGEWIAETAATCSATGEKGHYTCATCHKNFDENKAEIANLTIQKDAANHVGTDVLKNQKNATCKEDGYTGDICCSACGNVKTPGSVISKSTVAHQGRKTNAKNATCDAAGNIEYYTCSVCGKLFKDSACTQETNTAGVTVPAKGHNYGAWTTVRKATCSQEGLEQRVCANDPSHKETRPIAKTAHEDNGNGYCKNCGADLNAGNRCKCGKIHTGPFAWLIKFFHSIQYFFKNLGK